MIILSKILLSTDIGSDIDDALSLLTILNNPSIELAGIYTVNGDVESRCYIAKRMIELAGVNIPVAKGSGNALGEVVKTYSHFEDYLIDDIYLDEERMEKEGDKKLLFKPLQHIGVILNGIEHLANQLAKESCVVLSIGPLTNIAILLRNHREVVSNIEHLYIMGCRLDDNGMEHNIRYDVLAAQEVLNSNLPITIVPADICSRYRMPIGFIDQCNSRVGKYVSSMAKAFIGAKVVQNFREKMYDNRLKSEILNSGPIKAVQTLEPKDVLRLQEFKHDVLVNFEEHSAYLDRDRFLANFQKLIEQLANPDYGYQGGLWHAAQLSSCLIENISVADVYIPYCFLYPERIEVKKVLATCDMEGRTYITKGNQHNIVIDLDCGHFQDYLKQWLV